MNALAHLERLEAESIHIMRECEMTTCRDETARRLGLLTRHSERQGRVIDHDQAASMEKKKAEGYC